MIGYYSGDQSALQSVDGRVELSHLIHYARLLSKVGVSLACIR
jgi:hypothetical protein